MRARYFRIDVRRITRNVACGSRLARQSSRKAKANGGPNGTDRLRHSAEGLTLLTQVSMEISDMESVWRLGGGGA
jgi:hypothetical protein